MTGHGGYLQTVPMQGDGTIDASGNLSVVGTHLSTIPGLTATGIDQAGALDITYPVNEVSTVLLGTGVKIPSIYAGFLMVIINDGVNILSVYPQSGSQINALGADVPFTMAPGDRILLISFNATQWFTL